MIKYDNVSYTLTLIILNIKDKMVDFNNEATVSTPYSEIVVILILERRYNLVEALESYKKAKYSSDYDIETTHLGTLKSRTFSLYIELFGIIYRHFSAMAIKQLLTQIDSNREEDVMEAIETLLKFIDKLKITAVDSRKVIDYARVEAVNEAKRL